MIQANELRIGNRIKLGSNEIIVSKETIYNVENFPKLYSPIPLSEEWLVKFGFTEKKKWFYKENFLLGYLSTDDHLQAEWKFGGVEGTWNLIDIKYVHQLQNLYFALTGQELEANK